MEEELVEGQVIADEMSESSEYFSAMLRHRHKAHETFHNKRGRVFQDSTRVREIIKFAHADHCTMPPNLKIETCEILNFASALTLSEEDENEAVIKGDAVNSKEKADEKLSEGERDGYREIDLLAEYESKDKEEKKSVAQTEPLQVVAFDWNICQNIMEHSTEMYEIAKSSCRTSNELARLVIRRGQPFVVHITFNRKFDFHCDDVILTFQTGSTLQPSDRTNFSVSVSEGLKKYGWSVGIHQCEDNKVQFKVMTPVTSIIGKFHLIIETKLKISASMDVNETGDKVSDRWIILKYKIIEPMYLICNPFLKGDQVYMEDKVMLDEYILRDFGHIFVGNQYDYFRRPWKFAQFSETVLDCCLALLDQVKLRPYARGNAVDIVRAISNLVNSSDDSGLLASNWSGHYGSDTAPTQWLGSLQILEEYQKTQAPVKYGQCAVFAACAVTLCRCLGIPARCVTVFGAAHDCDGNNSINTHWDFGGKPIVSMNHDYVWSYHVWTEVFMSRPDIPGPYSGWQAFDSTPQLCGDGLLCAGPCPVRAIREADVHLKDGVMLMFSELNAYRYHRIMQEDGTYRNTVDKKASGCAIRTDYPRLYEHNRDKAEAEIKDGLDLLRNYKYRQDTEEERISLKKAATWATHGGVYEDGQGDVDITFDMQRGTLAGSTFDVQLALQNRCRYERNVDITLTLTSIQNTGLIKRPIRSQKFSISLCPLEGKKAVMRVMGEDYSLVMTDNLCFMIDAVAKVRETDQVFAGCHEHQLLPPRLQISIPVMVLEGEEFECSIRFENSLPVTLVNCEFRLDALGVEHQKKISHGDIEPYEITEVKTTMVSKISGKVHILASFHSRELSSVYGELEFEI